jgi:uncharacterized protein (TIGR02172 family)
LTILDPPIAIGFTAEVYAWKDGQVLKLFNQGISESNVEKEARLARIVHASGLPVPAVGEVVKIGERFGLEYERVIGTSMLQLFMSKPWRSSFYARMLAELQADMHTRSLTGLPSQREILSWKIRHASLLSESLRQAVLTALDNLPEDDKLCHGDFHPNNILLTRLGPVIIDWIDATQGSPILDVARSTLLFGGGPLPPGIPARWLVKLLRDRFYRTYLKRYFQINPGDSQQLSHWIPVVAAARLNENIHYDEPRLLAIAQSLLVQTS